MHRQAAVRDGAIAHAGGRGNSKSTQSQSPPCSRLSAKASVRCGVGRASAHWLLCHISLAAVYRHQWAWHGECGRGNGLARHSAKSLPDSPTRLHLGRGLCAMRMSERSALMRRNRRDRTCPGPRRPCRKARLVWSRGGCHGEYTREEQARMHSRVLLPSPSPLPSKRERWWTGGWVGGSPYVASGAQVEAVGVPGVPSLSRSTNHSGEGCSP